MDENQAAGRSKKSQLMSQLRSRLKFSRDNSRQSSQPPSPVPSRGKVGGNASATAGASTSTPEIRPSVDSSQLVAGANAMVPVIKLPVVGKLDDKSDNDQNAELGAVMGGSQYQKNQNTEPMINEDDNMWKIAEDQLRQDREKDKLLVAYYDILKSKLKQDLEPAGTRERQKQISAFIVSESESLRDTSKLGKFASVLQNAAKCILKTEKVVSAASQPCLPASIACAGVMLVLSLFVQAGSQREVLFKSLDEIPAVIYNLAGIEKLHWADAQDPEFKRSMTTLCSHILEFLARAVCYLDERSVIRIPKGMFNQVEWDVLLSSIKNYENTLLNHAQVNSFQEIRFTRKILETQENDKLEQQTAARNKDITEFLRKLNKHAWPGGDSYEYSKERVQRAEEGTCKWFTNHAKFKTWESSENPSSGSPLLLLTAYPGCGKSVLSKHLIDTVLSKSNDRAVCYFFFKDDFEHQKSAIGALCTLLHQLLIISESKGRTSLADSALQRFETMGEESFLGSVSSLWKTFTEAALHADAGEVICILDALDECRPTDRNELIRAINEFYKTLQSQSSCLPKLFLTTRPYGDIIQSQFSYVWGHRLPEIRLAGEEDDVANNIAEEVKIVVDKRIDQICAAFHLTKQKTNLMKTNLGAPAGRTYLWITLVFDDLLKKTSGISKEYIESFVKNPPKDVDDAYEKILNRSKTQGPGNQDLKKTRKILQMIVAAKRPLTLQEMSIALLLLEYQPPYENLADEIESKEGAWNIIRDCCGLLVIRVDDRLYLLHQTVREFLVAHGPNINNKNQKAQDITDSETTPPQSHLWKYSIDLIDANSVLAEACISYIHSNFREMDDSLLDYSAHYWVDHYHQSVTSFQVAAAERIRDLCLLEYCREWTGIFARYNNHYNKVPETGPPLCLASALGLKRAVEMFLLKQHSTSVDFQIDLEASDQEWSQTALSWSAEKGHDAVVQLLLEKGADLETKDEEIGRTPLLWAAKNGHDTAVQLLLEKGADLETKDEFGWTPLPWAAKNGHDTAVQLLLEKGADLETKNYRGHTPLLYAAERGHEVVVQLLLEKGADLDTKDEFGWTPLLYAASNGHDAVVQLLLEKGVYLETKDKKYGRTPLLSAARNGHEAVVQLLLKKGADLETKDNKYGRTPLSLAASNGYEAVVQQLLEKGADLETKDKEFGRTPLLYAVEEGHELVVQLLLKKGADLETKNYHGQTPLSYAAERGHEVVVQQLLEKGADLDTKDESGWTPLLYAASNGHDAVLQQLLEKGAQCNDLDLKRMQNFERS